MLHLDKRFLGVLTIFLLVFSFHCKGQNDTLFAAKDSLIYKKSDRAVGPILGYRGIGNSFVELGIAAAGIGHGIVGFEFSYLNNLKPKPENISGFSLGYYKGFAIFEIGINGNLYTDFKRLKLYMRPSFGLGIGGILTLGYGYNLTLGPNPFKNAINRHEIRLIGRIPIQY